MNDIIDDSAPSDAWDMSLNRFTAFLASEDPTLYCICAAIHFKAVIAATVLASFRCAREEISDPFWFTGETFRNVACAIRNIISHDKFLCRNLPVMGLGTLYLDLAPRAELFSDSSISALFLSNCWLVSQSGFILFFPSFF